MKRIFTLVLGLIVFAFANGQVVISQIYGGGGNTNAPFRNDFVELFNPTATAISLNGYSVQYAGATGSFSAGNTVLLTGAIAANGYYLIQFASGGTVGNPLPASDAMSTTNLSATNGKVALVNSITVLTGNCPFGATVTDLVGYGSNADCFFGTGPTPTPSATNTTAAIRKGAGAVNTDNNANDFATGTPTPRNSTILLPIQLLSFNASAKNTNIIFNWKTATETNTSRFEIEQSSNGNDFTTIATVAAAGNSSVEKSYSYTGSLNNTNTYYRLKMIDADGKFTTSFIVKVTASKNGFSLGNVYPVPAKNNVTIEWNSNHAGATSISITDISGRTIRNANVQAVQGFNQFVLDVQSLNAGQYFIRLKNDANQVQTIITKQ